MLTEASFRRGRAAFRKARRLPRPAPYIQSKLTCQGGDASSILRSPVRSFLFAPGTPFLTNSQLQLSDMQPDFGFDLGFNMDQTPSLCFDLAALRERGFFAPIQALSAPLSLALQRTGPRKFRFPK